MRIKEGICRYADGVWRDGDRGLLVRELTSEEALRHVELLLDQERKGWREELEKRQAVEREVVKLRAVQSPSLRSWLFSWRALACSSTGAALTVLVVLACAWVRR